MSVAALRTRADLQPLETLFEVPGVPGFDLPDELAAVYGGTAVTRVAINGYGRIGRNFWSISWRRLH
jgi:hypothetical protein